jgi:Holliday junction resolvase RusA-like endonuclease
MRSDIRESPNSEPIWISGRPAPKGSRTRGVRKDGRPYSRPASKFEKDWTSTVAWECARAAARHRASPPYAVRVEFVVAEPAKSTHGFPCTGDIDKLVRASLDGMVDGRLLTDDRYVTELHASVRYGSPTGANVWVWSASLTPRMAA